ncbi:MAG: hypothetical protein Q7U08_02705 [Flavobacteriaceae bacterium]|nr:hypothetical protein [Flavobacteriaceae bacterium]
MEEKKEYYYHIFDNRRTIKKEDFQLDKLYNYIKSKFFDYTSCKWKVKNYKSFVHRCELEYNVCYHVLESFYKEFFKENKKGNKGFKSFLNRIARLNETKRIKIEFLNHNRSTESDFIEDFKNLNNKYFNLSNKSLSLFIFNHFNINSSPKALTKYLNFYKKR